MLVLRMTMTYSSCLQNNTIYWLWFESATRVSCIQNLRCIYLAGYIYGEQRIYFFVLNGFCLEISHDVNVGYFRYCRQKMGESYVIGIWNFRMIWKPANLVFRTDIRSYPADVLTHPGPDPGLCCDPVVSTESTHTTVVY